jgi:hypothetical protein
MNADQLLLLPEPNSELPTFYWQRAILSGLILKYTNVLLLHL